jgi:hypothetical protein
MFSYAHGAGRLEFIAGLHALADYLAAHPGIPVPPHGADILLHVDAAEDGGCLQVRQIARQLQASVTDETPHDGHCYATRSFGPLAYRVISIPHSRMARHQALWSYDGCIDPATPAASQQLFDA